MSRLSRLAWAMLIWNVVVILWGAFVRATGSGAGCGAHWPTCNGDVIPRAPSIETLIEYTHRMTSGVALIGVVVLFFWVWRSTERGAPARRAASVSLLMIFVEAGIGAGLVLYELVAKDTSSARAVVVGAHLVSTLVLLASLTLTALWVSGRPGPRMAGNTLPALLLGLGSLAMGLLGATGAVAALGDTLFPARSLAEGMAQDFSQTAHILLRLRVLHPIVAMSTGGYMVLCAALIAALRPSARPAALALVIAFGCQIALGLLNLSLLAPVWLQLVHLAAADLVWICFIIMGATAMAGPRSAIEAA